MLLAVDGPVTAPETTAIADEIGLERFWAALDRLEEVCLVTRTADGTAWAAVHPRTAAAAALGPLETEIRRRQDDAQRLRGRLDALEQVYREEQTPIRSDEAVELIERAEHVRKVLADAAEKCTQEVVGAHAGGRIEPELVADALARDVQLLQRGVRMRTLLQHSSRADPVT